MCWCLCVDECSRVWGEWTIRRLWMGKLSCSNFGSILEWRNSSKRESCVFWAKAKDEWADLTRFNELMEPYLSIPKSGCDKVICHSLKNNNCYDDIKTASVSNEIYAFLHPFYADLRGYKPQRLWCRLSGQISLKHTLSLTLLSLSYIIDYLLLLIHTTYTSLGWACVHIHPNSAHQATGFFEKDLKPVALYLIFLSFCRSWTRTTASLDPPKQRVLKAQPRQPGTAIDFSPAAAR